MCSGQSIGGAAENPPPDVEAQLEAARQASAPHITVMLNDKPVPQPDKTGSTADSAVKKSAPKRGVRRVSFKNHVEEGHNEGATRAPAASGSEVVSAPASPHWTAELPIRALPDQAVKSLTTPGYEMSKALALSDLDPLKKSIRGNSTAGNSAKNSIAPTNLKPLGSRPVLNRFYSTPMNAKSPSRQHFRLHNAFPHQVKETPQVSVLEDARGRFINQYQITRVLGRGSFGMVYLAVDPQGQQYALKECSKRRLAKLNRAALMRFRRQIVSRGSSERGEGSLSPFVPEVNALITREIAVMKKLDHPNLVALYEVLDDPRSESLILVLEWCSQGTIMPAEEHYDGHATPIPEDTARLYFRDLLLGVEYLHARGVCHRDIKADNVLLSDDEVVKIADFGVSEIFDNAAPVGDAVERPVGSPAYMSPELVSLRTSLPSRTTSNASNSSRHERGHRTSGGGATSTSTSVNSNSPHTSATSTSVSGRKADIWAMGVTLYYMLHGKLPFEAPNMDELHNAILCDEPDLSHCPPELADMLQRIFHKDPGYRISLEELRNHPWVVQNGADPLLPTEENVQVSESDRVTEEDLRDAIDQIEHRIGSEGSRLDYCDVSRSLRSNYGWRASGTSSGARTPHLGDDTSSSDKTEKSPSVTPGSDNQSPMGNMKMEKLSRALEELVKMKNWRASGSFSE